MAKILGLDLGTNSIGWAVVDETEDTPILYKGVRIFSEGVKIEKGIESSKASERTGYRSARRLKFRRKIRKYNTLKALIGAKMCPLSYEELKNWKQNKIYPKSDDFLNWLRTHEDKNPYFFRNLVSTEKLDLENEEDRFMLGRAFYHLAQRRGFKSNRLDQSEEDSQIEDYKQIWNTIIDSSKNITELILNFSKYIESEETDDKKVNTVLSKLKKMTAYLQKGKNESFETEKDKFLKIINKEEKLSPVKQSIKELSQKITDVNCDTLGQYFYTQYKDAKKIRNNYTHRENHYEKEFHIICNKQNINPELRKKLHNAIFYQRPLRSQKGLVGKCTFEPSKARSPISHPLFEIYRMLAFINNIKYKVKDNDKDNCKFGNCKQLSNEQKNVIADLFFRKSKTQFDFKEIRIKLEKSEKKKLIFNFKDYTTVTGCPMSATLKNLFIDRKVWNSYNFSDKITFYKNIHFHNLKTANGEHLFAVWHVLFTFEDRQKVIEFGKNKLGLDDIRANQLSNILPKQGYASLSIKAIRKILVFLEKGLIFTHATFLANMQEIVGKKVWEDEVKQNEIIKSVIDIIDNHGFETKRIFAVNSLLKVCHDNHDTYSEMAEPEYKKNIEQNLKRELSSNVWKDIENKNELIEKSLNDFINLLVSSESDRKKYYAKIKRTDEKIFNFLKGENDTGEVFCSDDKLLKKLYHPSDVNLYKQARTADDGKKYLASPRTESVKNPVAMKTLHQLRHLINALIKEDIIDQDTKIHIELAREMNDANMRKAIENWQRNNQKKRDKYKEQIIADYKAETGKEIEPTQDEILKYQLWEEQKHICVYTGKTIGIADFIGADPKYDIEHTIPRSLSYDNSLENKTLADSRFNRDTKGVNIPFELSNYAEILHNVEHWKTEYEKLDKQIQAKVKVSRAAQNKETKDRAIRERHELTFERNYWRNKYKRFTMEEVPSGFKNSQLNDTRLISKFARAFMKTVFDKVYVINGKSTDEFKRLWGLPEKNRDNHIHHAMDAITIAAITKQKNDLLANYYKDEEKNTKPYFAKPWNTFTQDVKNMVNDTLIYHVREDNTIRPAKKKLRKRGKIEPKVIYKKDSLGNYILNKNKKKIIERYIFEEKNGKKIPVFGKELSEKDIKNKAENIDYIKHFSKKENKVKYYEFSKYKIDKNGNKKGDIVFKRAANYLQGDSIRGSLHQDTIYGAIQEKGYTPKPEDNEIPVKYVVRKKLADLSAPEINKIVDDAVREKIQTLVSEYGISALKEDVWMNKEKGVRIKKVRIYTPSVSSPLHLKKHRDLSKHEYKQNIHVKNDENYIMAVYEGNDEKGKTIRDYKIVNLLETAAYHKVSNKSHKKEYPIIEEVIYKGEIKLEHKFNLKSGSKVILLKNDERDIDYKDNNWLHSRFYVIKGMDDDGIKLYYHQEARLTTDVIKHMNEVINAENILKKITDKKGKVKISKLTSPKGGDVIDRYKEFPYIKFKVSNFNALIQSIDFKITAWGEIEKIER